MSGSCKLMCIPVRYVLVILGFWACFLNHAQRANLSVAIVAMVEDPVRRNTTSDECYARNVLKQPYPSSTWFSYLSGNRLNWDHQTQAFVLSSYYYGYVTTQVLGGRLAEMVGAKWLYFSGMLCSSLLCLLSPLVAILHPFLFAALRILQGLVAGAVFPLFHILLPKWIPLSERNFSASVVYGGLSVGNVGGLLFSGILCQSETLGGWQSAFYLFGVMGLIWCALWSYFVYESPSVHPRITMEELKYITAFRPDEVPGDDDEIVNVPWRHIFGSISVWALIVSHMGHSWGTDTLLLELPTYLHEIMGVNIGQSGVISSFPFILQAISAWLSAYIIDKLICSRKITQEKARKGCNSVAFLGAAISLISVTFLGCNYTWTIVMLCVAMFFDGMSKSGFFVNHMDIAPDFSGTLLGITNTAGSLDGLLVPYLVAFLTEGQANLQSWSHVFVVSGIVYLVSGIFFLVFGSTKQLVWASRNINRPLILGESLAKSEEKD